MNLLLLGIYMYMYVPASFATLIMCTGLAKDTAYITLIFASSSPEYREDLKRRKES